jgi:alpha-ketoglutarate-dependent taurine dioxygenase
LVKLRSLNQASFLQDQAPAEHPVVRIHPLTGRKCLYVSPALTQRIAGMADDESEALIVELAKHATQPEFCYRHKWQISDTLIWDNRGTMHTRHAFDQSKRRVVRRTQTVGEPIVAASQASPNIGQLETPA